MSPTSGSEYKTENETEVAQSCLTLWDPMDRSPPGSSIHGVSQARILEWVAISFSNARKWRVKVKSLSRVWLSATPWTAAHQAPPSMGFSRQKSTGVGCHCLLQLSAEKILNTYAKNWVCTFCYFNLCKASGGDGIPVELFQILKEDAVKVLYSMCQ